ncbi:glycogen synthase GlgA [Aquibacillus kalidii]|uniref:glycogen synthase GlgA n=1 Tax=Aquibacillus kalidii TaxID=2762597 RepID=UPI00164742C6|nr:glycogen synthase GlgA [Aquibacillus kalidii]
MEKKILFVASECSPFVKTGGLADVIGSLPQALKNQETDIRVILPLYEDIITNYFDNMEQVATIQVSVGWRKQEAVIYHYTHDDIPYYFIGNDYYFARKGIYGYYDDGERFVFFCRAVVDALSVLDFQPDVLHGHDWQAGLALSFAKILQPIDELKTVFTIHNIKYQGILPIDTFDELFSIPREHIPGIEWNGLLNCMKSGLFHADKITTVSPTYAEEIQTPYYGEGLYSLLKERQSDLSGILNGIDVEQFNPTKDPYIPKNYSDCREDKSENKQLLQEKLGLPIDGEIPLYVLISRLVDQKGLHLLQAILDEFLQHDVQVVVLGTGDYEFENYFYHAQQRNKQKFVAYLAFDEGIARHLYAASDFLLMPSLFEPCGLSQLIALQYKSVPIVRETGGLKDTITPYNELTSEGNGFSFTNYNAHDLLHVLTYSLRIYHDQEHWKKLHDNLNKCDFSWKTSAQSYQALYDSLLASVHDA